MARRGAAIHELIAWLNGAIRGGLLDDLPPYAPEPGRTPVPAVEFADRLLTDLTGPPIGSEPIGLVEARAFPFRIWVEGQLGDLDQRPSVRRSGTRRTDDPARRGLNVGRSLHRISKSVASPPPPDELAAPAATPRTKSGARMSLWILAALFLLPILAIVGIEAARRSPLAVVGGLGAIAAVGFLYAAFRAVTNDDAVGHDPDRENQETGTR